MKNRRKRETAAIIGEGITEKYYIESIKDLTKVSVLPRELNRKASNLQTLQREIENAINLGFDFVYCLIDMDGKNDGANKQSYQKLKMEFEGEHIDDKKGIKCKVVFIESERCTELWFLYHFLKQPVTRKFNSYKEVEKVLKTYVKNYDKTDKFFKSIGNLHSLLTKRVPDGSLDNAVKNAISSCKTKNEQERNYTYTEMHLLFDGLGIIKLQKKKIENNN